MACGFSHHAAPDFLSGVASRIEATYLAPSAGGTAFYRTDGRGSLLGQTRPRTGTTPGNRIISLRLRSGVHSLADNLATASALLVILSHRDLRDAGLAAGNHLCNSARKVLRPRHGSGYRLKVCDDRGGLAHSSTVLLSPAAG